MKRVILTPNPYRDKGFQTVRAAQQILKEAGVESRVCLPFDVDKTFDLRPAAIIRDLGLRRPIYRQTAAYGHFGRSDLDLPWEKTDRVDALKANL